MISLKPAQPEHSGIISRLARDKSGNVIAMVAASLFPLIALVGGGIDMGRGYLAQSRLQQACDAGTLAARKRLGSSVAVDGLVPDDVAETGQRFFNINFRDGAYGTENRSFIMALENDYSVSGSASVDVPTTLMAVFGFNAMDVTVECASILNFSDLDVMMVLDVTGSMSSTNPGDSMSRIDSLREVVGNFHTQIESSKAEETEIRYGFVPYNSNVNVGHTLQDDWVVDSWTYQGRERVEDETVVITGSSNTYGDATGEDSGWYEIDRYAAIDTFTDGSLQCDAGPASTYTYTSELLSETVEPADDGFDGDKTTKTYNEVRNGSQYQVILSGDECVVNQRDYDNYARSKETVLKPREYNFARYDYRPITSDMTNWRDEVEGCVEERSTYEITDYDNVDFARALDLDIDLVPTAGNSDTQWRPHRPDNIYGRGLFSSGSGAWSVPEIYNTGSSYVNSGTQWMSDCPPPAQRLQEMTGDEMTAYLGTLEPRGGTYHDIGMIWGGRLMSPTGLFAADNADTGVKTRTRHMIWMTDGQTEPYDIAYGAYGLEGLDRRRWNPDSSTLSLTETVESRFSVACDQVKNRNITVWVIAFGTETTEVMENCAGAGRYFQASNAEELNDAFMAIASSMSELRVSS